MIPIFFTIFKCPSLTSRFSKIQVDRPDLHSGKYIRLYPTSFPKDPLYLYDFDLYKTQKTHKNTRKDSLQNIGVILSVVWYAKRKFSRATFSDDVFLKLLRISRKNAGNTFKDCSFSRKASLDVSQSLYIEYLQLISSFTW